MRINKLEQLRKSFYIEKSPFKQFYNGKGNFLKIVKFFESKVYHAWIKRLYDSLYRKNRNHKQNKGLVAPFFNKTIQDHRSHV